MLPTRTVSCPYCGEPIELIVDDSVEHQQYVEDCSVCCRPIEVEVTLHADGELDVNCTTDIDA
ncbi:MAG: CPXCG motif-containing cysteine-rich protein [Gammaproteobacteria bacterium]